MLYNTVSTLGLSRRLQNSLTELQIERMRTAEEMSTGNHFDVAASLGAQTGRSISLRNIFDATTNNIAVNAQTGARFEAMDTALGNILAAGTEALAAASVGLGQPSPTGDSLQIRARAMLDQIVGQLNATAGNEALFGGTAVQRSPMRPVDGDASGLRSPMTMVLDAMSGATGGSPIPDNVDEAAAVIATLNDLFGVYAPGDPAPDPALDDTFEGGFYLGTTVFSPGGAANPRQTARLDAATSLPYGIQANDPAMRDLLQGLYMLAAVDVTKLPNDTGTPLQPDPPAPPVPSRNVYEPYMKAAVDKISAGVSGLRDSIARLGIQHANLDSTTKYHQANLTILNRQISDLEGVDPAEASVRLDQLELQIDATASATARLAQMSLTRYL